ncbi:MAG: hypothetical protein ISQ03_06740 [Pseudomonadales bacterium]|jgi:hypothetical protein|nr:hypothetical protein [Pseudomonadales bacterium]MBL6807657.1 hypothetical protein [Pseudomonadales bacterium]
MRLTCRRAAYAVSLLMVLAAPAGAELLIYGPKDTFWGCIDCSWRDERSVCAPYGTYGDVRSEASIWNRFGPNGNPSRFQSPWHDASLAGPELVTEAGRYLGRFSIHAGAFRDWAMLRGIFETADRKAEDARKIFCDYVKPEFWTERLAK